MTKFDNLYSAQDHLREEQQKLLKALLQNQSAKKTQKPSGAPAGVAPEIDVKKEKDIRVSFYSDKKSLENNNSAGNGHKAMFEKTLAVFNFWSFLVEF